MILFIEDELRQTKSFHEEFELAEYEVKLAKTVDEASLLLTENAAAIQVVILDIMMSPGELLRNENTERGLRTGLKMFEKIREEFPTIPVVVFTNVTDKSVIEFFSTRNVPYLNKRNYDPDELLKRVEALLEVSKNEV